MEAARAVELTGTNGRNTNPSDPFHGHWPTPLLALTRPTTHLVDGHEHTRVASTHRSPNNHTTRTPRKGGDGQLKICGGHGPGETPGPIPNPEAKTWHGDGTAPDRVWESSTPPHSHVMRGTPGWVCPSPLFSPSFYLVFCERGFFSFYIGRSVHARHGLNHARRSHQTLIFSFRRPLRLSA